MPEKQSTCFFKEIAVIAIAIYCNNESLGNNKYNEMKHDEKQMKNMKMD